MQYFHIYLTAKFFAYGNVHSSGVPVGPLKTCAACALAGTAATYRAADGHRWSDAAQQKRFKVHVDTISCCTAAQRHRRHMSNSSNAYNSNTNNNSISNGASGKLHGMPRHRYKRASGCLTPTLYTSINRNFIYLYIYWNKKPIRLPAWLPACLRSFTRARAFVYATFFFIFLGYLFAFVWLFCRKWQIAVVSFCCLATWGSMPVEMKLCACVCLYLEIKFFQSIQLKTMTF